MAKAILWEDLLTYNPNTGELHWKVRTSQRTPAGAIAGSIDRRGYRVFTYKGNQYKAHRVIWEMFRGPIKSKGVIDHTDGDTANNRISNLRLVNASVNGKNCRRYSNNTSGAVGVHWNKAKRLWEAYITSSGTRTRLGRYSSFICACEARIVAEVLAGSFTPRHGT